jgi:uncharacterized membrane protein
MRGLTKNMNDWERTLSVLVGSALLVKGVRHRAWGQGTGGAGLIARGLAGWCPVNAATGRKRLRDDPRRALAGARGFRLEESVTIAQPIDEVFAYWRNLTNLPVFMPSLERVEMADPWRSHWVMRGPAGTRVEWDAEIINEEPPNLIGWQSLPGADMASAGSVNFRPARLGTEVRVLMQYNPPAGKVGGLVAWLAGQSPAFQLREDLRRFKQILETGELPTAETQPANDRRQRVASRLQEAV